MQNSSFTFPELFADAFRNEASQAALSFVDGKPLSYGELESRIYSVIAFYEQMGVQQGDRIAILSTNMPNWGVAYFAATFMGAVAVPLLPDFSPDEIANILRHSGARVLLVSSALYKKVADFSHEELRYVVQLDDFSVLSGDSKAVFDVSQQPQKHYQVTEDTLASIIYTSGTTGKSKGVMLTHKNISFNAVKASGLQEVGPGDRFLSVLPLSHTYENTIGFILPLMKGATIYYLRKPPTPAILLPALKKVKPTMMLSVPLIIEKVYRNKIRPQFQRNALMRNLYRLPFVREKLHRIAGKKLIETFGGNMKFFGIGGAKLDPVVERFLQEAKFPYAIGYGLTETAPLLAGSGTQNTKLSAVGPVLDGVELKIHNPDPKTREGEIWAKGPNVMQGYYKEPGLTREAITSDGWFKTGDLGVLDKQGNLAIKGRLKNVIVGSSGENIYPEEIEAVINNFRYVVESLVIQQKGKLVAMVHLNYDEIETHYRNFKAGVSGKFDDLKHELKQYINEKVSRFSRVQLVMIQPEPFQKTATHKIKRFLYMER